MKNTEGWYGPPRSIHECEVTGTPSVQDIQTGRWCFYLRDNHIMGCHVTHWF